MGFRVRGLGVVIAFAVAVALGGIVGNAVDVETDFEAQEEEEQTLCYEIQNQVLESGKRLCDLEVPGYAVTADGTRVDGRIVWYFPETGTVLDEKMTITGESGEQYVFGWRFIPAEAYQGYEPVDGQVEVTICVTGQNGESRATNQDGSISTFSQNEGNNSAESDSSPAEDTAEKETGNDSAGAETQRLWDALVWAMAQNTDESETEIAADSANVSGHFLGSSTVTVVPDGIDPSSLMGSATTGIGILGKIVSKASGTIGTAETESSSTKTQKDTAEAGKNLAETDNDTDGTGTSQAETQKDTAGTGTSQAETQEDTSGTEASRIETQESTAGIGTGRGETGKWIAETDGKSSGTNLSMAESDRDSTEEDSAKTGGEPSDAKEDSEEAGENTAEAGTGIGSKTSKRLKPMTLFKRRAAVLVICFILGTNRFFL